MQTEHAYVGLCLYCFVAVKPLSSWQLFVLLLENIFANYSCCFSCFNCFTDYMEVIYIRTFMQYEWSRNCKEAVAVWLSWQVLIFSSAHPGMYQNNISNSATTASHILSIWIFTNHPVIRRCMVLLLKASFRRPGEKKIKRDIVVNDSCCVFANTSNSGERRPTRLLWYSCSSEWKVVQIYACVLVCTFLVLKSRMKDVHEDSVTIDCLSLTEPKFTLCIGLCVCECMTVNFETGHVRKVWLRVDLSRPHRSGW